MYDCDDPAIRSMILDQHRPYDSWTSQLSGPQHMGVACVLDRELWPCRAAKELRAWEKEQKDEFVKSMKEAERRIAQQFRPSFLPLPYYGTFPDYYRHTFTYTYEPKD
jgi:hypothetical protein